eukprot:1160076-Pelagomonas_calceolata.AAC.6
MDHVHALQEERTSMCWDVDSHRRSFVKGGSDGQCTQQCTWYGFALPIQLSIMINALHGPLVSVGAAAHGRECGSTDSGWGSGQAHRGV